MTTLQEAARPTFMHCACLFDGDTCVEQCKLHAAHVDAIHEWAERAKTAENTLAQQGEQAKPAAYITDTHQGPMVWTPEMYGEACMYCDDGEFPVPLYTAAPAPQAQEPHGAQQLRERIANAEPTNSYDLAKRADNGGQP